jgi:hypothetical protein
MSVLDYGWKSRRKNIVLELGFELSVAKTEIASPAANVCVLVLSSQLVELSLIVQVMPVLTGTAAPAGSLRTVNV